MPCCELDREWVISATCMSLCISFLAIGQVDRWTGSPGLNLASVNLGAAPPSPLVVDRAAWRAMWVCWAVPLTPQGALAESCLLWGGAGLALAFLLSSPHSASSLKAGGL
jgi:hypothetical protein